MIYTCIYDNIPHDGGYGICAKSPGFPAKYEPEIKKISGYFGPGTGYSDSAAIRYAPLRDDRYLFSLILRHPQVSMEEQRAWHTVVHFLMDETDAQTLFTHPITWIVQTLADKALKIYNNGQYIISEELHTFLNAEQQVTKYGSAGGIDDKILMAGVSYCMSDEISDQLFLVSDDPCGELEAIQWWLPDAFCKRLSFCLGLENLQESTGTVFNFHQAPLSKHGTNAPRSNKYWHGEAFTDTELLDDCDQILSRLDAYPWLKDMVCKIVTEWEELALLADDNLSRGLSKLIIETGVNNWVNLLDSREMSRIELERLASLLGKQKELKPLRNAIGRRLKRSQRGRYEQGRNAYDAVGERPNGVQNHIQRPYGNDRDNTEVHKILLNHVLNAAAVVALAVVAIALITLARQTLMTSEIEVEQVVYYCISREAAVDVLKLCGAFVCGFLAAVAGKRLFSRIE